MDGKDLARWTRFAIKGGIGKCTAVQDCIAESPEDLMFLKDDEITVLLQLPTQAGWYLGYCEGVVGRFQGSHVRFHGKLKRPVKAKRQSTSAMSAASTPVQSATPSPRGPVSPLTISMPNSGSTPELARDSTSFTNPFDLEFDSSLEVRDDFSVDEERLARRTRTADDLPGLEMFLPRSRSGSRSRPSSLDPEKQNRSRSSSHHGSPLVRSLNPPPSPPPGPSPLSQSYPSSPKLGASATEIEQDPIAEIPPPQATNEAEPERDTSRLGNESEAESSHLYDAASLRSSFYSVNSYRSSVIGNNRLQTDHNRQRLSKAEFDDDGLGMGIGLSMLQDFGDDEDEDADTNRKLSLPEAEETLQDETRTNGIATQANDDSHPEEARHSEELEPKSARDISFEENVDDEGSEVLSDDESYWDGGDIYDNYRYSRYSVMTKASKRKSRFSMMSRNSAFLESPKSEVPPLPKDPDGLLLADSPSREFFNTPPTEKKKVPPPLSLTSEARVEPILLSPNTVKLSDLSPSKRPTSDIASPQPSPLLHTSFPSPTTSSGYDTSVGRYSDVPDPSPSPSALNFSGAASSLRQRLEGDRPATPPTLADNYSETSKLLRPRESAASTSLGGSIVVEDNDEVNVTVIPADEEGKSNHEDFTSRESFQSMASQSTVTSAASDMTDMSQALRKFEKDLATLIPGADHGGDQSDFVAATTPTTTQPLRLADKSTSQTPAERPVEQITPQIAPPRSASTQGTQALSTLRAGLLRPDQSPFMPHPNAPRPNPAVMSGQRVSTYGMPPVHDLGQSVQVAIQPPNAFALHSTLREAAAHRVGPAGVPHHPTIYGKPVVELTSADGPVPMTWSLRPFPPDPPSAPSSPAMGGKPLRRAPTGGSSPLSQAVIAASNSPMMAPAKPPLVIPGARGPPHVIIPGPSRSPAPVRAPSAGSGLNSTVISRPNFAPQVGGARPRSRSFSGFDRAQASQPVPETPQLEERKPSRSSSIQSLKEGAKQGLRHESGSFSSGRSIVPSPLSQSQGSTPPTSARSMSISKGQPSPLGRTSFSSSQTELPKSQNNTDMNPPRRPSLSVAAVRQIQSVEQLKLRGSEDSLVKPPSTVFEPVRRNSNPSEPVSASVASPSMTSTPIGQSPVQRLRRLSSPTSSWKHQRTVSQQSQTSSTSDLRSTLTSPVGEKASNAIKTRLSLAHLRIRSSTIKEGGSDMQSPSSSTAPGTPVHEVDNQSIRVQDAEFELIRPTMMRRMSSEPTSDSSIIERDDRASLLQEGRVESPVAGSIRSMLSPIPASATTESPVVPPSPIQPAEDASAHRAREQKWMTAMSSTPAAQARKSKKIRRLVIEGVPSSLRYLVWGHLTDSKARRIPGVYGAFGKRENVNGKEAIERDATRCFPGQPHLQDPKGPLVGLLKTYTILVPDLEYQSSLALVAGHLLLQSPEEDGFWTFVAMMDIQLRAYYSPKSVQLEADSIVFAKAAEALFPSLHKKLFLELGIPPMEVCRMWFPSLFSATLPQKYTNRIWDVYFCEGPPFIFRVALALLSLSRTAIEGSRDRTSVQALIAKPEVMSILPDDPEDVIIMALGLKVKDDDIMKQRVKFEAQLRQHQHSQSTPRSAPRLLSSISLPRPKASLQS